jgi:hypothetical protein
MVRRQRRYRVICEDQLSYLHFDHDRFFLPTEKLFS